MENIQFHCMPFDSFFMSMSRSKYVFFFNVIGGISLHKKFHRAQPTKLHIPLRQKVQCPTIGHTLPITIADEVLTLNYSTDARHFSSLFVLLFPPENQEVINGSRKGIHEIPPLSKVFSAGK